MKLRKQRLLGLAFVAISAVLLLMAATGTTPEERDATAVLLILPLGLCMVYSKIDFLNDCEAEEEDEPEEPQPYRHPAPRAIHTTHTANTYRLKGAATWQGKE